MTLRQLRVEGGGGGDILDAIGLGTSTYLVPHIKLRPQHFRMSLLPFSLRAGNRNMMRFAEVGTMLGGEDLEEALAKEIAARG